MDEKGSSEQRARRRETCVWGREAAAHCDSTAPVRASETATKKRRQGAAGLGGCGRAPRGLEGREQRGSGGGGSGPAQSRAPWLAFRRVLAVWICEVRATCAGHSTLVRTLSLVGGDIGESQGAEGIRRAHARVHRPSGRQMRVWTARRCSTGRHDGGGRPRALAGSVLCGVL